MDRLTEAVTESGNPAPRELVGQIEAKVRAFAAQVPQADDMTMLCLRYLGQ